MRIKLFEEFENEKPYLRVANEILEIIESTFNLKLSKDLFYDIIKLGEIEIYELKDICRRISNLDIKQETIFTVIINTIYPEVRESKKLKDIYWNHINSSWNQRMKTSQLYKDKEFEGKIQNLKNIIKNYNIKTQVKNDPEWPNEYEFRKNTSKYNL